MPNKFNPFETTSTETALDIELLKREVGQYFPFYDMRFDFKTAAFFCRIDEETLEEKFDMLRRSLSDKGYIPMLRYEKGEHIIYVIKKMKKREKPVWINIFLLIAVIITTVITGSILHIGYFDIWSLSDPMDILQPVNLFYGAIYFSIPLMSILVIHEMGHYFISKKHGVATSLPFFLPIPPILPSFNIGTFGALISSRDPMPNKKALFDIGIAGPLAGFIVAIPVTAIGILTAEIVPMIPLDQVPQGEAIFGSSFLIEILARGLLDIPTGFTIDMNPILFAGWVGLLITSINLLPAGQLDGGHIFRAVLGDKQKYAGWIAIAVMIFTGWWFFAFIIIFAMGLMHPPPLNDDTGLDLRRKMLFLVAIAMLLLCFIPFPIYVGS
jgi:membrane-associated protease RseP (regulator of RpoE activity)